MNYKDRMNAIGKASGVAAGRAGRKWGQAVPGQVYPPINGPGNPEWEKRTYPTLVGRPVDWAKAAISILSNNADPINQETADIVNNQMGRLDWTVMGPASWRWRLDRDIERYLSGGAIVNPPTTERPSYGQQQPPTRSLPVERPDFSQPPMGGGSDRGRKWGIGPVGGIDVHVVGPASWRWQAQMRPDLIGLPYEEAIEIYKGGSSGGGMGMRERAMGGMK